MGTGFKQKFNNRTGKFNLVPDFTLIRWKGAVNSFIDLPMTNNLEGDAFIIKDSNHLYIFGSEWHDMGNILDIKIPQIIFDDILKCYLI